MTSIKFNKKTAALTVALAALVIIGVIMLVTVKRDVENGPRLININSEAERVEYLASCGWEVKSPALSEDKVVIPRVFSEVFDAYNDLQLSQGFDLSQYCGLEATLYNYEVTNCDSTDTVIASLYIRSGCVIGGDVHSTALDGFMLPLRQPDASPSPKQGI